MSQIVRVLRAALIVAVAIAASLVGLSMSVAPASALTASEPAPPPTPSGLPSGIEDLARYVGQTECQPGQLPGTMTLARLLVARFPDTSFNTSYSCGTDGSRSEHYDGRAIDWMVNSRNPAQAKEAASAIHWFLATDKAGHLRAIAKRIGLMYVIWNGKIWGSYNASWEPYQNCLDASMLSPAHDSYCHRNHVHISLSWNGATGRTSFFSKKVFNTTDYGPCRATGMNWAQDRVGFQGAPCPRLAKLTAPAGASSTYVNLLTYSGASVGVGDRGPIVSAIQAALHRSVSGTFDTGTRDALISFQKSRGLTATGRTSVPTWIKLLAVYKPK